MLIIGLTGGIGSGKSTVAKLFSERGVSIIDADVIARELTKPGEMAFLKIREHFGKEVLLENGLINREKLRNMIFESAKERLWLENLLHPLIRSEIEKQIKKISAPYCMVVIPLLIETKHFPLIDRILVVDTPEHLQIERVIVRDKVSKEHVESILKTQAPRSEKVAKAHDLIINDGKIKDLEHQVEKLHHQYQKGKM